METFLDAYGWTYEQALSHTYPQLYLMLDARLQKNAEQALQGEEDGRPLPSDPVEEHIRYDVYEAAKMTGAGAPECEKRIEMLIAKYYAEKDNPNKEPVIYG